MRNYKLWSSDGQGNKEWKSFWVWSLDDREGCGSKLQSNLLLTSKYLLASVGEPSKCDWLNDKVN